MKIDKSNRPRRERVLSGDKRSKHTTIRHSPFLDTLQIHYQDPIEFDGAIESIDEYARRLKQSPTFGNLKRYKEAVRALLHVMVQHTYTVGENSFFDRNGRRRVYVLVQKIDEKLEELTRLFLKRQVGSLDVVRALDEIRGLLVDMYS